VTPAYLWHITLDTGHSRRSPRAEVDAEVVATMADFLASAAGTRRFEPMPGPPGYAARVSADGGMLMVTIVRSGTPPAPLVTLGVATRSRHAARLWQILHDDTLMPPQTDPGDVPSPPWLAVRMEIGILTDPSAVDWLADAERCIAWAWIDKGSS